jgi:hypothetical protein
MSESEPQQLDQHASARHAGFAETDPEFEAARAERARLIRTFLKVMEAAGNPGASRKLGSTVRNLTGQESDEYWAATLVGDGGKEREVIVFTDGRHGWSDELAYSDRPRSRDDEIAAEQLKAALSAILDEHDLSWPDED